MSDEQPNKDQPEAVYVEAKDVNVEAVPVADPHGGGDVDHNGIRVGAWKTQLFSCFDDTMPNCLMSFFCPCFSFAQVVARLGWYDYTVTLIVLAVCFCTGFLSVFGFLALFFTRNKMREVFKIPGSPIMDCIETFFCGCCSLAQMATHIGSYKKGDCNFNAPETLPGYKVV